MAIVAGVALACSLIATAFLLPTEVEAWGLIATVLLAGLALFVSIGMRSHHLSRVDTWATQRKVESAARHDDQQRRYEALMEQWHADVRELEDQWRADVQAFQNQKRWWAVAPIPDLQRIDVLGGVSSGWSADRGAPAGWDALVTTFCATRVEAGNDVTVLDLTGAAVAQNALNLFEAGGVARAAYVLPNELPQVHVAAGCSKAMLHELLSNVVHAAEERGTLTGWAQDAEVLRRVIDSFQETPSLTQVLAGLRVLAQVGDVRDDLASGLIDVHSLNRLNALYGERAIQAGLGERLLAVLTHLEPLSGVSAAPVVPRGVPLKVYALDRRAPAVTAEVLRAFLVSAFTALVNQATPGQPWSRTIVVCGADRVPVQALGRLQDACATARVGLIQMFQVASDSHQRVIGKGNAAVVFMRLGTVADAEFASRFIGTEHRFELSQITESVGRSITDTTGTNYSKTVGTSKTTTENWGTSFSSGSAGGTSNSSKTTSHGFSDSLGYSDSTTWGTNTSSAVGENSSDARTLQRSKENLVEPSELQTLPPTAFIYAHGYADRRTVLLGDANPSIATRPDATALTIEESPVRVVRQRTGTRRE